MKTIMLGIKDYIKDCWHDFWFWVWLHLENFVGHRLWRTYCWRNNDGCYTKEGNLWHYIQQRKIAKERKAVK